MDTKAVATILRDNNVLQLEEQQLQDALEQSREYWYQIANLAFHLREAGFSSEFTNPRLALHRIPKLQVRSGRLHVRPYGMTPIRSLCCEASSIWTLSTDQDCGKLKKQMSHLTFVQVGIAAATSFSFIEDAFSSWNGMSGGNVIGPNYLGILALGWCYVLCAQLVKMRGEDSSMQYTQCQAGYSDESLPDPSQVHVIDVGEVDESVARWWSAILAPNEGWKATVKQTPQGEFLAPWSVSRACETHFSIKYQGTLSPDPDPKPLSSERAFKALVEFARLHELQSQFPIALTMALTIPTHKYYRLSAKLPLPRATGFKSITTPVNAEWMNLKEDLPYYMTLSCSPEVMMSTFCGAFWEQDVPCNLVSPWLHPIINEVLGDLPENELEVLAFIGTIRQPRFSAFWIGAIASGLGPEILHRVRGGHPPLDRVAFPWTGCPQSFMDVAGSGPYTCKDPDYILREDVWRLTNYPSTDGDNESYQHGPRVPWAPCGASLTRDCALYVTAHLDCPRHEYEYDHWVWYLPDGTLMQDRGFSEQVTPAVSESRFDNIQLKTRREFKRTQFDQEASREASGQVFLWYFFGGEGLPSESIYQEEWLKEVWENNMSEFGGGEFDDGEVPEPVVKSGEFVDSWLDTVS
ncbi:similar to An01g11250 [Aspergillus luchuensis]|uniref:Similar to An01g11250 n=1 Tax=Aspergillus kawachii TaxID=1069201 RepID=A0A146FCU8_ASPKA|nr:similar to An01g11250 [Aspergillus luchuensis]